MCCHTSIPQPKTFMFGRLPTSIQEGDQLKDHNSYLLTFQPQGHRQHVEGVEGFPAVDCVEMVKSVSAHLLTPPRQCTRGGDHLETPPLSETSGTVVAPNHISSPLKEASIPASAPNSPCRPWWHWNFLEIFNGGATPALCNSHPGNFPPYREPGALSQAAITR